MTKWVVLVLMLGLGLTHAQTLPVPPAPPTPPAGPGKLYTPGAFDRLELAGIASVLLVQGERDQAFIAGDAEVQKSVDVVLTDRQLAIRPTGGWKFWTQTLVVKVEMRELRALSVSGASEVHAPGPLTSDQLKLSISGAGSVRLDQLQARQLAFGIAGAGEGHLSGRVDEMAVRISGKGKVLADKLLTQRASINVSGIGAVQLSVAKELSAHISGIGSVDYYGKPSVQRSISGMGTITAKGDMP